MFGCRLKPKPRSWLTTAVALPHGVDAAGIPGSKTLEVAQGLRSLYTERACRGAVGQMNIDKWCDSIDVLRTVRWLLNKCYQAKCRRARPCGVALSLESAQ